ncbi:hypothetical protein Hanom_Chr10g00943831 [Helianthus anomalus]
MRDRTALAALRKASCMESGGRAHSSRPASSRRGGWILSNKPTSFASPVVSICEFFKVETL